MENSANVQQIPLCQLEYTERSGKIFHICEEDSVFKTHRSKAVLKNEPHPVGIKSFLVLASSGIVLNFVVDQW